MGVVKTMSRLPMRKKRRHKGFWVKNGVIGFFGCLVVLTSCINLWILQLHSQNQQQWLPETATTATTRQQAQVAHPNQPQQLRLQKTTTTTRQLPAAVRGGGEEGGRERVKAIFKDAGIELTRKQLLRLPSWSQIEQYIGAEPIIVGLETCADFRRMIPAVNRSLGSLGMFNSGTNLVTKLIKENCKIPERIAYYGWKVDFDKYNMGPLEAHGMRWQVPWGKHTAAKYREIHKAEPPIHTIPTESVMPVITVRHPYHWMRSMCKHPYSAKWDHNQRLKCPHLATKPEHPVPLTIKYAMNRTDQHTSLAHLWNDWYGDYYHHNDNHNASLRSLSSKYPRLMVRFEDLVFHSYNVTVQVCHCVGGEIRSDRPFQYIQDTAKEGPGHGKDRTDMLEAWIRYSQPVEPFLPKFDNLYAQNHLDPQLMDVFHYQHPPGARTT